MRRLLLPMLLFATTPAVAAPTEPSAVALRATVDWFGRVMDAYNGLNGAFAQLQPRSAAALSTMRGGDRAGAARQLQAIASDMQAAVARARGEFAALRRTAPGDVAGVGYAPVTLIDDAERFADGAAGIADAVGAMGRAILAGDGAKVQASAQRLATSSIVLIDGQIAIVRGRQALVTQDASGRASLGVMLGLYHAMRSQLALAFSKGDAETITVYRRNMATLGKGLRETANAGRAALASEDSAVARQGRRSETDLLLELNTLERETFAVADEIAGTLDALGKAPSAGPGAGAGLRTLSAYETRLQDVLRRQVEVAQRAADAS